MAKKASSASATPTKGAAKNGTKNAATPSKKKNASPKKRATPSKPKGKTIKGDLSVDPEMEKEADEEEEQPLKKTPVKKSKKQTKKVESEKAPEPVTTEGVQISSQVIDKAITALSKYIESKDTDDKPTLFDDDGSEYFLQITTTKFLASKPLSKPKSILIPHRTINEEEDFKVCLFVKDNVIDLKLLEQIEEASIPFLSKIITAKELKGEYKPYEAKRKLVSEYDLFLSDDYLIPTLPKLLGKVFYESSTKFPIPVRIYSQSKFSIKTLTNSINKIVSSVTYIPPVGVNVNLKIGNSQLEKSNLIANIQLVVSGFESKLQNNNKIRTVLLKTVDSPSLPLYYLEKIFSDEDIASDGKKTDSKQVEGVSKLDIGLDVEIPEGVKLTEFEKGLLELAADPEDVEKILSKKVKQAKKRKNVDEEQDNVKEEVKSKKSKK